MIRAESLHFLGRSEKNHALATYMGTTFVQKLNHR